MKKSLVILAKVIVVLVLFGLGVFIGRLSLSSSPRQPSDARLERAVADATEVFGDIQMLDKYEIEQAKNSLNLQLNCDILLIHGLLKCYPKSETTAYARELLYAIAKHRQEYPAEVIVSASDVEELAGEETPELVEAVKEGNKTIQQILEEALVKP